MNDIFIPFPADRAHLELISRRHIQAKSVSIIPSTTFRYLSANIQTHRKSPDKKRTSPQTSMRALVDWFSFQFVYSGNVCLWERFSSA